MFNDLRIELLEKGGYVAQSVGGPPGSYCPHLAAFTTKSELLKWLDLNLEDRSPDLVDRRPQAPAKKISDEIPF